MHSHSISVAVMGHLDWTRDDPGATDNTIHSTLACWVWVNGRSMGWQSSYLQRPTGYTLPITGLSSTSKPTESSYHHFSLLVLLKNAPSIISWSQKRIAKVTLLEGRTMSHSQDKQKRRWSVYHLDWQYHLPAARRSELVVFFLHLFSPSCDSTLTNQF